MSDEDVDMAIRVMLESFIQAQKFAVMRSLRTQFSKFLTYKVNFNSLLLFELQNLVKEAQILEAVRGQSRVVAQHAAGGVPGVWSLSCLTCMLALT